MIKLRPCPFCGGTNLVFDEVLEWDKTLGAVVPVDVQIICRDCLIVFNQQEVNCEEDLAREWNRRTEEIVYTEEDVREAFNDGFSCGIEHDKIGKGISE